MTYRPPPRVLVRILEIALPDGVRGRSMVGDLVEEWNARRPGPRRTVWFAGAALALAARYALAGTVSAVAEAGTLAASALRGAAARPFQTAVAVLALGVGIAAPATMFSVVEGITREVEVDEPERLVRLGRRFGRGGIGIAPTDRLRALVEELEGVQAVGLYSRTWVDLSDDRGPATRLTLGEVTPGVFEAFGVDATLGRAFTPGDAAPGATPVIVLSEALWRDRFGADPDVPGRTVRLDGVPRVVVGVMPRGFASPGGVEAWVPLDVSGRSEEEEAAAQAVARVASGTSVAALVQEVEALDRRLAERDHASSEGPRIAAQRWSDGQIPPAARRSLRVLLVLVGFVLVIACANVVNLLLARAVSRGRETAVRIALGAGRRRVVARHLVQATVLALLAGAVAAVLTVGAVRVFEARTADALAHWMDLRVDVPVLLFGAAMVALAALGTGVVPALQASRIDVAPTLRDGGRTGTPFRIGRLGRFLVAGEVALSCMLLVVAGILVRGALENLEVDGSYATTDVLTARYDLRGPDYDDEAARRFHGHLLETVREEPGVADAALASHLPGVFSARRRVEVEGDGPPSPEAVPWSHSVRISPGFLSTLESGVVRGRDLSRDDGVESEPVALVNEAFVRERLAGRDPLGARVRFVRGDEHGAWRTVVGVVPALGIEVGRDPDGSAVYVPISQGAPRGMAVLVRVVPGTDPFSLLPALRETVEAADPDLALYSVDTLEGHIDSTRTVESTFATLFLTFGLAGLLLAGVGLYGLLAFSVGRRVRELGVRMALGAAPARLLGTAVGRDLLQLGLGLVAGLALAALVAPSLGVLLLDVDPHDPAVYGSVTLALGLTGLTAALAPARRALGLDPVEALRVE